MMLRMFKKQWIRYFYFIGGTRILATLSHHYQWDKNNGLKGLRRRRIKSYYILRYHRVNQEEDPFSIEAIHPNLFEKQMAYIRRHYSVMPLDDMLRRSEEKALPWNSIAVTFDDGYHDNYAVAFPILKKFRIPATIFLTTGSIGGGQILWFDRVLRAFKQTKKSRLEIDGFPKPLLWKTIKEKADAAIWTLKFLRGIPEKAKDKSFRAIIDSLEVDEDSSDSNLMLNWDQVRELHKQGILFGSHTVTHPILSQCDEGVVLSELVVSKRMIEERINDEINSFAYPSGRSSDLSEFVIENVKRGGYRFAVTIGRGANDEGEDLFRLRRNAPWSENIPQFAFNLAYSKMMKKD